MFFTRFEDEPDTQQDTAQQRLIALKEKISAKRQVLHNNHSIEGSKEEKEPADSGLIKPRHPKKRKKVSGNNENVEKGNLISKEETSPKSVIEDSATSCKRKKKKRHLIQEGDIVTHTVPEENGNSKRKKKRKQSETNEDTAETDRSPVEDKINCPNGLKDDSTLKKKKKKKKQRVVELEDTNVSSSEIQCETADISTAPIADPDHEENQEGIAAAEVSKPEVVEEWTILGKHKKTERVRNVKRDLPDWIVNRELVDADLDNTISLADFGLLDSCVQEVLNKIEITSLFPVQSYIIPDILAGCQDVSLLSRNFTPPSDLCVSAPTGSGKTFVYVLSLVQCLYKLPPLLQAVVVLPTKNLANQVKNVFNHFGKLIKVVLLSGKDTFPTEQKHLFTDQGSCLAHVVVTTPGRLVNHIRDTKLFTLRHLRFLVIDEMDTLLNQTYQDWLPTLFSTVYNPNSYRHLSQPEILTSRYSPKSSLSLEELIHPALPLQKLLFSATVTHDPSKLAPLQLYKPRLYSCAGKYTLPSTLVQYQIRCELQDKALVLVHLVKELGHVLCFTSSVDTSHRLALLTEEFKGIKVAEYSSSLTTQQRNKVVRDFDLNQIQLLVCSDSLARGMDLTSVDHVINYDVPAHVQTYVHRVGRTARAGRVGNAYTLIRHEEIRNFHQLLKKAGNTRASEMKVPVESIAQLSVNYEDCLARLETRLKSKSRK